MLAVARLTVVAGWMLRRAVLYSALVVALAIAPLIAQSWQQATEHGSDFRGLSAIEDGLRTESGALTRKFEIATSGLEGQSLAVLDARISKTKADLDTERRRLEEGAGVLSLYRNGPQVLLANQRCRLQIALLERQLASFEAARTLVEQRGAENRQAEARRRFMTAQRQCAVATARQSSLERTWSYRLRSWVESPEHRALAASRNRACGELDAALRAQQGINYVEGSAQRAQVAYEASRRDVDRSLEAAMAGLAQERQDALTRWNGTFVQKLRLQANEWHLGTLLTQAFWALLLIILTPFLVRLLFWFVLAPVAERRPAIRLVVPGGPGRTIPPAERSTTSVAILLGATDELLVRQAYLQTTSQGGSKATQWLLDWQHPIASLVSGMSFLTRIRGEGEITTVSAVHDPFAEVAILTLPKGASCVLQPRALAAVVQPIGRPLRITSHWRLTSLNAWLTLQLRYLVFHGPCRLVVKGGRGVRVERAERGRIFGQAQLVGFSADLAYSVTRNETFWPYFTGYDQLFKDKVEAGEGVLLIEEAPMAGRKSGAARHGLEGAFEVLTKPFGF